MQVGTEFSAGKEKKNYLIENRRFSCYNKHSLQKDRRKVMNKRKNDGKSCGRHRYLMSIILILSLIFSVPMANVNVFAAEKTEDEKAEAEEHLEVQKTSPDNLNRTGYDVVYVIDNSRSVWNQQEYRNQAFKNITNLAVGADIRIGVVYFADHIYKSLALTSMETQEGSQKVLDFLNMTEQDESNIDTDIGTALETAASMLDSQDTSREKIVVLFSDGINENLAESSDYKSKADGKTGDQAGILKNMDAAIYCVYLQKERNDEEYLKNLVNYFSTEEDYTGERFLKVKEKDISQLSSTFAKVFYSMQHNMKYRLLEPDSNGDMTFYVPKLGVKKLTVYLDGNLQENTKIYPAGDSNHEKWEDGSATFITYDNPVSGNWALSIDSPEMDSVFGTLAYYPELQAGAELKEAEESSEDGKTQYQLRLHFYDESGTEIPLEDKVKVTAALNFAGEDGSESSTPLEVTVEEGVAASKAFTMDGYGEYSYSVNLTYENYIDLHYSLIGTSVGKSAPVTTNIDDEFQGEKTDEGIQFSIQESRLWKDPEGEAVTITNVVQLNAANPVSVDQKDGYVLVTAQKASDVEFELQLQDSSGMSETVSVKGTVKDQAVARTARNVSRVFLMLVTFLLIYYLVRKVLDKIELKKRIAEFEQTSDSFTAVSKLCEEEENRTDEYRSDMALYLHGDVEIDLTGIIEMALSFTVQQQELFGVAEYVKEGFEEDAFREEDRIYKEIQDKNRTMYELGKRQKAITENQKEKQSVRASVKAMSENCSLAKECLEQINKLYSELKAENGSMEELLEKMEKAGEKLDDILSREIRYDLTVSEISAVPHTRGTMSARTFSGAYKKGSYQLDAISLLGGNGTLGQRLGNLGIYVYGYKDEESGAQGLLLNSLDEFAVKDEQGHSTKTTEAKLFPGHSYQLTVHSRIGETNMKLSV